MKLLQVKVSKQQLENIQKDMEFSFEVKEDQLETIFETQDGDLVEDPDYNRVLLVKKFDGILFMQCRSKFPYCIKTIIPEAQCFQYDAREDSPYVQNIYYTLGQPIAKEELNSAEIVEL